MNHPQTTSTPKEVVAAILFLRDEVRKGKLSMVPLLKRKLLEIGLYRERAFQKLVDEGRRAFLGRTRDSASLFRREVESLRTYEITNDDFRRKVQNFLDLIFAARTEDEIYARVDILKSFLEEFGFMSQDFLRHAIGSGLYEKYRNREVIELMDETEQEAQ